MQWLYVLASIAGVILVLYVLNLISYQVLKGRIVNRHPWDLNVCCGKTDGGGINADIVKHREVPNMVRVDVYHLPFGDAQFSTVLCSHTIEHVDDPERFYREMARVGRRVTLVIPPLWDLSAAFNLLEHRWLFLSLKKEHDRLPPYVKLPLAGFIQDLVGQRIHA